MNPTFAEALDRWELQAKALGYDLHYILHIRRCVGYFDTFLKGEKSVNNITADDFRHFQINLQERLAWFGKKGGNKQLSRTSMNTYQRGLKAFFSWLRQENIIAVNPLPWIIWFFAHGRMEGKTGSQTPWRYPTKQNRHRGKSGFLPRYPCVGPNHYHHCCRLFCFQC